MIVRYFELFGHQRSGSGFAADLYFMQVNANGGGGGFFGTFINAIKGGGRVASALGQAASAFTGALSSTQATNCETVLRHITNNPEIYGYHTALKKQHDGSLHKFVTTYSQ